MITPISTIEEAFEAYFDTYGKDAAQPANYSDWSDERDGWLLENTNGPLALVKEDGEVVDL